MNEFAIQDLDADVVELTPYVPAPAAVPLREMTFRSNAWLPDETEQLRRMFAADASIDEMVVEIGRKRQAIRARIYDLGLRRNSARPWSELEDAELVSRYGAEPAARIAQDLGRGVCAVYARASLHGLQQTQGPDYDPWEDAQLTAGYAAGVAVGQIAALVGRPLSSVAARAGRLGLQHPAKPKDWSDAELSRALVLAHEGRPYEEIRSTLAAEGFPARSKQGFGLKLRKLGYGRGWGRAWAPDEDVILRAAYAAGESLTSVANRTGRDRWSVSSRASVLKLQGSHPRPNGFRQGPDWSRVDEAKLRAEYASKPVKVLAAELGRPLRAVYVHANQLGLKHSWMRSFSHEDDLVLRTAWLCGVSIADAAKALGRDGAVVAKRAVRIGVSFSDPRRPAPPSRGVRKSTDRLCTTSGILGLAPETEVHRRLQELGLETDSQPRRRGRPARHAETSTQQLQSAGACP